MRRFLCDLSFNTAVFNEFRIEILSTVMVNSLSDLKLDRLVIWAATELGSMAVCSFVLFVNLFHFLYFIRKLYSKQFLVKFKFSFMPSF